MINLLAIKTKLIRRVNWIKELKTLPIVNSSNSETYTSNKKKIMLLFKIRKHSNDKRDWSI